MTWPIRFKLKHYHAGDTGIEHVTLGISSLWGLFPLRTQLFRDILFENKLIILIAETISVQMPKNKNNDDIKIKMEMKMKMKNKYKYKYKSKYKYKYKYYNKNKNKKKILIKINKNQYLQNFKLENRFSKNIFLAS